MSFKCRKEKLQGIKCHKQCNNCLLQTICQDIIDSGQVLIMPNNISIITIEDGADVHQIIGNQTIITEVKNE